MRTECYLAAEAKCYLYTIVELLSFIYYGFLAVEVSIIVRSASRRHSSVRLSVIKAVVPCQNKIILKNFIINIHEAVLQPIAAFVYYNPRQQQAVAGRQKSEISTRRRRMCN